jgi:hypothetical protein
MIPVLRDDQAVELHLTARLGKSPRYAGSIHDDETARRFGYGGALIPGAFLYGYMSRLAVASWGEDWLCRGTMQSHSRRPVYDGDRLLIAANRLVREGGVLKSAMAVTDSAGRLAAIGAAALPDAPPDFPEIVPIMPIADPPVVTASGLRPGDRFGTLGLTISAAEHQKSLEDFGEVWPGYAERGIVHPGMLLRLVMRDAIASYRYPTTGIFVAGHTQFFGLAHVGDCLETRGGVTVSYERNGNHYYESEQLVTVNDGTPVALIKRTAIYAARPRKEQCDTSEMSA